MPFNVNSRPIWDILTKKERSKLGQLLKSLKAEHKPEKMSHNIQSIHIETTLMVLNNTGFQSFVMEMKAIKMR